MTSVDLDLIYGKVKLDLNCSKSSNGGNVQQMTKVIEDVYDHHFQTSSAPEALCQLMPNRMCNITRSGQVKFTLYTLFKNIFHRKHTAFDIDTWGHWPIIVA